MKKGTFYKTAGIVFLAAAAIHLFRAINQWDLVMHEYHVPMWVSWTVVIGAGYLAYKALEWGQK